MGVTIGTENKSIDMGYAGFARLRMDVAGVICPELKALYETLPGASFGDSDLAEYNMKLSTLQEKESIPDEVLDFLYQPDVSGEISSECAGRLLEYVCDYDNNIRYGYIGRKDCAMFRDFKDILLNSVNTGSSVLWY